MKKVLIFLVIFLIVGCSTKEVDDTAKMPSKTDDLVFDTPILKDSSPIKLGLYEYQEGKYVRTNEYSSKKGELNLIGLFSVYYTTDDIVYGYNYKSLWNNYYYNYENINDYRIGYEISYTLEDGTSYDEVVLKPLDVYNYSFSGNLYIWVYDDINTTATWYSHLEESDYNDKTLMSSIKLMWAYGTEKINSPITLTVFAYKDKNDFDESGNYIGNSRFTLKINGY